MTIADVFDAAGIDLSCLIALAVFAFFPGLIGLVYLNKELKTMRLITALLGVVFLVLSIAGFVICLISVTWPCPGSELAYGCFSLGYGVFGVITAIIGGCLVAVWIESGPKPTA